MAIQENIDRRVILTGIAGLGLMPALAFAKTDGQVEQLTKKYQSKVIEWRRYFHQNPELSNREFKTAEFVASELRKLGFEVREKVAKTGVIGILKGGKSGPNVALRADMDGLPVLEKTNLSFASKAQGEYEGKPVPIAHSCGHDAHMAMLLGAASVLNELKANISGNIVFIFQPAEEGPPKGETGGAKLLVEEGILDNPKIKSIFGIHVWPGQSGKISYRPKGFMAAADRVEITIEGRQTHGAQPWSGVDLSALSADIVGAINQIMARQINVTAEPSILSITTIHGGERFNIIPETYALGGTLRTFSDDRRADIIKRVENAVQSLAQSYGAKADVHFHLNAPLTYNDPKLTESLHGAMISAAGSASQVESNTLPITGAEDFSEYQKKIPGLFVFLGSAPPNTDYTKLPPNHSPYFDIYEPILEVGVRAHVYAALEMAKL